MTVAFLDTLLVDDNDIRAIDGIKVVGFISGLFAPATRRGDDTVLPGEDGELGEALPLAKYVISAPIMVLGDTRGERNDNLRAAADLLGGLSSNGLVTLTRRIAKGAADLYDEDDAPGRFIGGLTFDILNPNTGRTELQWYNLAGGWSSDGEPPYTVP